MTEKLPISICCCNDLLLAFEKIRAVCNKLEAQFCFQTMTANWYEDESNILIINLNLVSAESFIVEQEKHQVNKLHYYFDDVFSVKEIESTKPELNCYVAITHNEFNLLHQQPKLLSSLLQMKLRKVLNLVAKQKQLSVF